MKPSLQKILKPDGRALVVAMDHARDWGAMPGLEHPGETISRVIEGGADAIFTSYGVAKQFSHLTAGKVGLVVRLDGYTSRFKEKWLEYTGWNQLYTVEDAIRVGADAVLVCHFIGIEAEPHSLRVMAKCAAEADRLGIPLIVETMPCKCDEIPDPNAPEIIAAGARIATEHGADMIKCYYSGTVESFRQVIDETPAPVLIAGGPQTKTPLDSLKMVSGSVKAGGAGVFYGRNIWQAANPVGMTQAIADIIHKDADPEVAEEMYLKTKAHA
jgi:fructose-bisphosphate aldolase, class I